ncbi:hypothetical protein [Salinarimonas rosea]|uniref:hypothetical protein n=1 Tax=Salinarimonas rosea TaxID=552063 RepID=UPI000416573D|nr:hypothetical protein [Salinarimonas rosea]
MYGYYIHVSEGGTIRENVAELLDDGTVKHEQGTSFLDPKDGGYVWRWTPTGGRMQVFAGSGNALYWQSDDPVEAARKLALDRALVCVVEGTPDEAEQLAKIERAVHRLAAQIAED